MKLAILSRDWKDTDFQNYDDAAAFVGEVKSRYEFNQTGGDNILLVMSDEVINYEEFAKIWDELEHNLFNDFWEGADLDEIKGKIRAHSEFDNF